MPQTTTLIMPWVQTLVLSAGMLVVCFIAMLLTRDGP